MSSPEIPSSALRDLVRRVVADIEPALPALSPTIALGCDHGGFPLKQHLRGILAAKYPVIDCGAFDENPVDYPDYAYAVARLVSDGSAWRGIVVDGAGIGSCMAANKVPGIRAAMAFDAATARNAREHNDANVLTLGGKLITADVAAEMAQIFLTTECREPRHLKRVDKIMRIERRFLRK